MLDRWDKLALINKAMEHVSKALDEAKKLLRDAEIEMPDYYFDEDSGIVDQVNGTSTIEENLVLCIQVIETGLLYSDHDPEYIEEAAGPDDQEDTE